jgi:hypothetical protein
VASSGAWVGVTTDAALGQAHTGDVARAVPRSRLDSCAPIHRRTVRTGSDALARRIYRLGRPVTGYAARSKDEEPGKDSTGDQIAIVIARIEGDPDRFVHGGPFIEHPSGSKSDRGPGLADASTPRCGPQRSTAAPRLWAWISSRFARGSGRLGEARALGKLYYRPQNGREVARRDTLGGGWMTDPQPMWLRSALQRARTVRRAGSRARGRRVSREAVAS